MLILHLLYHIIFKKSNPFGNFFALFYIFLRWKFLARSARARRLSVRSCRKSIVGAEHPLQSSRGGAGGRQSLTDEEGRLMQYKGCPPHPPLRGPPSPLEKAKVSTNLINSKLIHKEVFKTVRCTSAFPSGGRGTIGVSPMVDEVYQTQGYPKAFAHRRDGIAPQQPGAVGAEVGGDAPFVGYVSSLSGYVSS